MKNYSQSRTCGQCGNQEARTLSSDDAAFTEARQWKTPCNKCGNSHFSSVDSPLPEMNRKLFGKWIYDENLSVFGQDEEIILGVGENLPLLEEFLIHPDALSSKRAILLSAICVVLHDNHPDGCDPADEPDPDIAFAATNALRRNIEVFDQINEFYISDYIKNVVYPIIGRTIPKET